MINLDYKIKLFYSTGQLLNLYYMTQFRMYIPWVNRKSDYKTDRFDSIDTIEKKSLVLMSFSKILGTVSGSESFAMLFQLK